MKLDEIKPFAKNAKKHTKEQIEVLKTSISEDGFLDGIVLDKNNEIIAGHGRLQAVQELGMDKVKVIEVEPDTVLVLKANHLDGLKANRARIRNNQIQAMTGNDTPLLVPQLQELNNAGFPPTSLGFSNDILVAFKPLEQAEEKLDEKKLTTCPECGAEF